MSVRHYTGGCQCGTVRYEVEADLDAVVTCNCSRCVKLGAILTRAVPGSFRLLSGDGGQTEYRFHKKVIEHLFCSTCGIESFARGTLADGTPAVVVNVRCLDGVDPTTLTPKPFDGRSL